MKIIQNKFSDFILAKGFAGITIWPFIFIRTGKPLTPDLINHERIHGRQQIEMLIIPFFLWYGLEWLYRILTTKNAYRNISFEREAYANDDDPLYLDNRRPWGWIKYL